MEQAAASSDWVVLGQATGHYGVRGWIKVYSYTSPLDGIARYSPLYLNFGGEWRSCRLEGGRMQGKGVVLKFEGVDDRDAAAALIGCEIGIQREQLPPPSPGEYYWTDLEGLRVLTLDGVDLGRVDHLFETGANDVLVVRGERERLIPFLRERVVREIDLDAGLMRVDWDPDF
ncbi:ribosome maturation factor RimM [Plasticicumulans acidivorans]|uniref:Ribosome maturation factor RimM n=1 Tax=Plasticicumulans acidivorans TaxID=886464 RepID=A0A317MQD2_9GAMM|nr:16S rRNA processing protein RimM [Plasticicumulans acidivorans]